VIGSDAVFLGDGEMYDIIVDVVGDETSLEFCALSDYYLEDNTLDAAIELSGVRWANVEPLIDEIEEKASALRDEKRQEQTESDND